MWEPRGKDLDKEFLYVNSLAQGVGSNDIGLDRGQLGNERVVKFQKAGNKLLLIQPNQNYRAITDNDLERKSIEQAFAKSVLFGFKILWLVMLVSESKILVLLLVGA